jgi:hypothetical protein
MEKPTWKINRIRYCDHAGREVSLEAEVVFPAEYLPETPPRICAHRCSLALECQLFDQPACIWAGSNPDLDPFQP